MESGEYFLNEQQRKLKKKQEKALKASGVTAQKNEERRQQFIAPSEEGPEGKRKGKDGGGAGVGRTKRSLREMADETKKKGGGAGAAKSFPSNKAERGTEAFIEQKKKPKQI